MTTGDTRFETTHWSLVLTAARGDSSDARQALASLCEIYWYPLYAYVRRQGHNADDALHLTQAFFTRLIERRDVQDARRERGRFRSFLLASMKHFLLNESRHRRAVKRGGDVAHLALDFKTAEGRYLRERDDPATPEALFDRRWALTVLDRALGRLRRAARRTRSPSSTRSRVLSRQACRERLLRYRLQRRVTPRVPLEDSRYQRATDGIDVDTVRLPVVHVPDPGEPPCLHAQHQ